MMDVVSLAAGASYSCGVTNGGQALCWGDNSQGQLGSDASSNVWLPATVAGLADAETITIGGDDDCPFTCATTADQSGFCWGCNARGALGRVEPMNPEWDASPAPVQTQSDACETMTVILGGGGHACGRTPDDELCCWGGNDVGQTGLAMTDALVATARVLEHPPGTVATWDVVGLGGRHGCALVRSGSLLCWGANDFGQLGTSEGSEHYLPRAVPGFDGVQEMSGGVEHTCVLRGDGTVWCFGQNFFGQLGDGTNIDRASPGPVAF